MYSVNPRLLSTVSFNLISSILKQVFWNKYFVPKVLESFKMQEVQMKIVAMEALGVE